MHDAVARRDDLDVLESLLGPLDEVEAIFVSAVFDGTVLGEGVFVIARKFDRKRVIDDQLRLDDRIDLGRVTALVGYGVAQSRQIDQRRLAEDIVTDDARRIPREIEVLTALDQLFERGFKRCRVAAPYQVFGVDARGVGQHVVGAW